MDAGLAKWPPAFWNKEFRDMERLGLKTIIIQYVGAGEISYYPSKLNWFTCQYDLLNTVMTVAANHGFEVYLGLYLNGKWWSKFSNKRFLEEEMRRNSLVIEELSELYKENPAFSGWYIPHEVGNLTVLSWCSRKRLAWFFKKIANYCKVADGNKPVGIAPYFSPLVSPVRFGKVWYRFLKKTPLDLVMLQDGVGCQRVSLDQARLFFKEMEKACSKAGVDLWGDLEVFDQYHGYPVDGLPFAARPANMGRIKQQIDLAHPYIKKLVCFEYNHYMSLCRGEEEFKLYQDYKNFISNRGSGMLK